MVQPIKRFRNEGISVAIWQNASAEGEKYHSITVEKTYKDKEGNWKTSKSYFEKDLPILLALLNEAIVWIKENTI